MRLQCIIIFILGWILFIVGVRLCNIYGFVMGILGSLIMSLSSLVNNKPKSKTRS